MTITKIKCREHGGYFTRPIRRGRPPVRCAEEYPCNAQQIDKPVPKAKPSINPVTKSVPASTPVNDISQLSMAKAKAAKAQLELLGWTVAGKAWTGTESRNYFASITATRGEETLYMQWINGKCIDQQYSLWDVEKPAANSKPASNLPFDPEEIPDAELAQLLIGMKVTWYNRLSGQTETAYCGKESIQVEHHYSGTGDERPGDRVIKFTDPDTQMFRAFRLDQLIKVG